MEFAPETSAQAARSAGMLVVDDHELVRLGLRTLVQSYALSSGRTLPVFEACTLQQALGVYHQYQSDISLVLLDLHLPDAHGLSGLTTFVARFPAARVVVLSAVNDPALVREALATGASAYLTKSGDLQQVVGYIRSQGMLDQEDAFSTAGMLAQAPVQKVAEALSGRTMRTATGACLQLTARQGQVLDWILVGQSNRAIADMAGLSEGTVKNHVSTLLLLFGVRSRAQLISLLR